MKTRIKVKDRYRVTIEYGEAPDPFKVWVEDGMFTSEKEAESKKTHKYAVKLRVELNLADPISSLKKKFNEAKGLNRFKVKVEKL